MQLRQSAGEHRRCVYEEIGGPDYPRCEVQLFQSGAMAYVPLDQVYWVFIENGG